jgi:hypothetical protein
MYIYEAIRSSSLEFFSFALSVHEFISSYPSWLTALPLPTLLKYIDGLHNTMPPLQGILLKIVKGHSHKSEVGYILKKAAWFNRPVSGEVLLEVFLY